MAENTNTEREASDASAILSKICDLFQIGKMARTESTILVNVKNVIDHARLLHAVERDLFPQPELPEDDDPYATVGDELPAPNSWAAKDEADYVAQFRAALAARASLSLPAAIPEGISRDDTVHGETYFTAEDMATAEARGFRAGRASLSLPAAGQEPVARTAAERDELFQAAIDFIRTLTGMEPPPIEVAPPEVFAPFREFVDKVQSITARFAAAPQPAVAAGWVSAKDQLPPCRDDQEYIGINTAGFAGVFNAVRVFNGNTYCLMDTAEDSVSIMSNLDLWKPFIRPAPSTEGQAL